MSVGKSGARILLALGLAFGTSLIAVAADSLLEKAPPRAAGVQQNREQQLRDLESEERKLQAKRRSLQNRIDEEEKVTKELRRELDGVLRDLRQVEQNIPALRQGATSTTPTPAPAQSTRGFTNDERRAFRDGLDVPEKWRREYCSPPLSKTQADASACLVALDGAWPPLANRAFLAQTPRIQNTVKVWLVPCFDSCVLRSAAGPGTPRDARREGDSVPCIKCCAYLYDWVEAPMAERRGPMPWEPRQGAFDRNDFDARLAAGCRN